MSVAQAESQSICHEQYGASLRSIRALGSAAMEIKAPAYEVARDDFYTSLAEMLKTDTELRERLDVEVSGTYHIHQEHVAAKDGTPMVALVRNGYDKARSDTDPRIVATQSIRDYGDVLTAEKVDTLREGQLMMVVSADPAEELSGQDQAFWQERGYRKGIAYLQWYYRQESSVVAGAMSVDSSDLHTWKQVLGSYGVERLDEANNNTLIQHAYTTTADTVEDAHHMATGLRSAYYDQAGVIQNRQNVNELIAQHSETVDEIFNAYYPKLGIALETSSNDNVLQSFALQVLGTEQIIDRLSSFARHELIRIANTDYFDDAMARTLEEVLRYSVVEILRARLVQKPLMHSTSDRAYSFTNDTRVRESSRVAEIAHMQQSMITALTVGINERRTYGGCSGTTISKAQADILGLPDPLLNPQDAFGGKGEASKEDEGPDGLGPLTFKCTEGHTNTREKGKLLTTCRVKGCKEGSVGCK